MRNNLSRKYIQRLEVDQVPHIPDNAGSAPRATTFKSLDNRVIPDMEKL